MSSKPLNLPPAVAKSFVEDMKAYFAEENGHKRDEIAARQLSVLKQYQKPREKALRLSDIKDMFTKLKGVIG